MSKAVPTSPFSDTYIAVEHYNAVVADRDRYGEALEAIRDHGKTHDQPCYAISNGDCADVMQEIARAALATNQEESSA